MSKILTRYLAASFIPPFVIGFIFFVAFLNTFYMFRIIDLIVTKGIEVKTVLGMVVSLSASFFPLAAPLSVFFATIYTLNKFSEDSEIIAMRSFGVSKYALYLPFCIVSILIGGMIVSLCSNYIPRANANFKNTIITLTSAGMLTSIKSGQFFTDIPNATLFAESVSEEGDNLENIFIHTIDKSTSEKRIIFSKKGSLIKLFGDDWHAPNLRLHLTDGNIVKIRDDGSQIEKILFQEYDFPIFNADFGATLLDKDSMKTNSELIKIINKRQNEYSFTERTPPKDVAEIDARKNAKRLITKSQIEYYERYIPLPQIICFVLLGFSLGIKNVRNAGNGNSLRAIIILLSYYAAYFLLLSLAQKGVVNPFVASFTPSFVLFGISIYYYKKLDWVG